MMSDWYLRQQGQTSGPFSWEDLRFLADRQKIAAGDMVRQGTKGEWLSADSVRGLIAATQAARPSSAVSARPANVAQPPMPPSSRARDVAQPPPAVATRPPLPPLPPRRQDETRRRIIIALVAATGLLAGLLCLLLLALLLRFGAGAIASGSGGGNGGGGAGESAGAEDSSGSSDGFGKEETPLETPPAPDPAAKGDEGPTNDIPPTEEPGKQSSDTGAGNGSSPDAAPEPPPPPSAAVVMPLDDEPSPDDPNAVDPSSTGGSAEFFEIKGSGRRFVYVVDCSGSMSGQPFDKARAELQRSIERLNSGQSFFVVFFDDAEYPQFYPQVAEGLLRASAENKRRVRDWLSAFQSPGGGTDPQAALLRALSFGPDAVYLLSDGVFNPQVAAAVRARNRNHTAIHTVSFMTREAEVLLQNIARQNRGTYRFVP